MFPQLTEVFYVDRMLMLEFLQSVGSFPLSVCLENTDFSVCLCTFPPDVFVYDVYVCPQAFRGDPKQLH